MGTFNAEYLRPLLTAALLLTLFARGSGGSAKILMPQITKSSFVIAVPDLKKSAAFYPDILGFTIHSISDSSWLFYRSGDCTIMAGECRDAILPPQLGDHSNFAYLGVDDIDALHKSLQKAGVGICKTLRDATWQMREIWRVTADGHRIMFGTPIPRPTSLT